MAIFDSGSSNATHAKRADVMRRLHSTGARVLWIEVFNTKDQVGGWVGGWVSRKMEGNEAVEVSYCVSGLGGWVGR